ncbi:hypothetical protein SKAU_G00294700 [Synaphobranchus kaupii]|uniref:ZW10 interactor n=1 Tax=Synaphobranchus kaupii TaxID=118154 RepID=A0A9Q1EUF5_SYNKA|nr:hypothetical protein SKAU_G00294700 [Synaphobranchus kaupii]
MATERAQLLVNWYEAGQKDVFSAPEVQDAGEMEPPAAVMVPYLADSRKKLKMIQLPLCVLDHLLLLLESAQSPHLLNTPSPQHTGADTRARLEALKSEYSEGVQRVEGHIAALLERIERAGRKKEQLEQLLSTLERKKEELKDKQRMKEKKDMKEEKLNRMKLQGLENSLLASQGALQLSERHISELVAQTDAHLARVDNWTLLRDGLQQSVQATLGLTGYKLLWVGPQEVCVELVPQVYRPDLANLKPLPLSLTWSLDGLFTIQSQGTAGILDGALQGPLSQVSAALQEITQRYLSQGEMLAEIQEMHSRFAIDWRPAQRLLVFLRSALVVCHFNVGEGYPSTGRASLLSVRGEKGPLNIDALRPPQVNPSLTEWLEFLTSCPDI